MKLGRTRGLGQDGKADQGLINMENRYTHPSAWIHVEQLSIVFFLNRPRYAYTIEYTKQYKFLMYIEKNKILGL